MQKPTIAIIGPGRARSALGRALHTAGYTIAAIGGRNPDNVRNLADELGSRAVQSPATTLDLADLTILAVPDDVILPLSTEMVASLCSAAGHAAVHLSGAQDRSALRPLAQQGSVRTGVFHPLQTFRRGPDAVQNVAGTYFGIAADQPLRDQLMQLAVALHGNPLDLTGVDLAPYHAAAVFAANYPVTLLAEPIALAAEAGLDPDTLSVTMEDMIRHAGAVVRGAPNALIIGDMPFMTYHASEEDAIRNAGRFLQEARVHAVKMEGGGRVIGYTKTLTSMGIPVMGHLGLTPTFVNQFGGYRVQGRSDEAAEQILADARALEDAGAFAVVLEAIPSALGQRATPAPRVPTLGIGAVPHSNGQV